MLLQAEKVVSLAAQALDEPKHVRTSTTCQASSISNTMYFNSLEVEHLQMCAVTLPSCKRRAPHLPRPDQLDINPTTHQRLCHLTANVDEARDYEACSMNFSAISLNTVHEPVTVSVTLSSDDLVIGTFNRGASETARAEQ